MKVWRPGLSLPCTGSSRRGERGLLAEAAALVAELGLWSIGPVAVVLKFHFP